MTATTLKKMIRSIFIGLIVITAFPVMASSEPSTPGNGDAVLTTDEEDPLRKRTFSTMTIQLIYEDGRVSIFSDFFLGEFSLVFENYETGEIHEIPSIQVGQSSPLELEIGEYQVNAIGEDGSILSGFMQVY